MDVPIFVYMLGLPNEFLSAVYWSKLLCLLYTALEIDDDDAIGGL